MARQKTLTKKEKGAIQGVLEGKSRTRAVQDNYNVKKYHTAGVMANKIFNRNIVKRELNILEGKIRAELAPKAVKVIENILDKEPENKLSWDTKRRTAESVLEKSGLSKEKDTKRVELIQQFIQRFEKKEKSGANNKVKYNNIEKEDIQEGDIIE